jgi:myosin heavy subunit
LNTSIESSNAEVDGLKNNLLETEDLKTQISVLQIKLEQLNTIEQKKVELENEILEVNESKLKIEKEYSFLFNSSNLKVQEYETLAVEKIQEVEKVKIKLEETEKLCESLERDLVEFKVQIAKVKYEEEKSIEKVQLEKHILESELLELKTQFNPELIKELELKLEESSKNEKEMNEELQTKFKELTQKESLMNKEIEELKQTIVFNEQEQMLMSDELKTTNIQSSEFLQKYEDLTLEFDKLQNEYQTCIASETEKVSELNLEVKNLQSSSSLKYDNLMVKTKQIEQLYNDTKVEKESLEGKIMEIELKIKEEVLLKTKFESDLLKTCEEFNVLSNEKLELEKKGAEDSKVIEDLEMKIKQETEHYKNLEVLKAEMINDLKNLKSENNELGRKQQALEELKVETQSKMESMVFKNDLEVVEKLLSDKASELIAKDTLVQDKETKIRNLEEDLNVVRVLNFLTRNKN